MESGALATFSSTPPIFTASLRRCPPGFASPTASRLRCRSCFLAAAGIPRQPYRVSNGLRIFSFASISSSRTDNMSTATSTVLPTPSCIGAPLSSIGVGVSCLCSRWRRAGVGIATAKKKKSKEFVDDDANPAIDKSYFPEAVLLKKEKVREDGQVLPDFADEEEEKLYKSLTLELQSKLNLERMRHYEVVYLIHKDHVDEVDQIVTRVQDFIREKNGMIYRVNNWGLRRLAYEIRKTSHANYILMNFEIDAKFINDFKSMLDKDERIIRHLVMKQDKAVTEDCPPPLEFHTLQSSEGFYNDEVEDEDDGYIEDDEGDFEEEDGELEFEVEDLENEDGNLEEAYYDDYDEEGEGDEEVKIVMVDDDEEEEEDAAVTLPNRRGRKTSPR